MSSWHSYPKIYALGHRALKNLLEPPGPIVVQEKVDGSQLSFGLHEGKLRIRSRGREFDPYAPDSMFTRAAEVVRAIAEAGKLVEGYTYRGEYLRIPKHNALVYDRTPRNHICLFDVGIGAHHYLSDHAQLEAIADSLELEAVRSYPADDLSTARLKAFLENTSQLGGQKIEGVVVKNYGRWGEDGHVLMGKYVSEAFKEVHAKAWGESNPSSRDILVRMQEEYRTPARWQKAVLHMREEGRLEQDPRDIQALLKEVIKDIETECESEIKEKLWNWARKHIMRGAIRGLPEWYKDNLLSQQFSNEAQSVQTETVEP